jgi:calcium permeable stress-gated cation channel
MWYIRWFGVNAFMFIVLFFLTTPAYVVQAMRKFPLINNNTTDTDPNAQTSPLITEFLPTLMLWSLTALMPIVVAYSESWLSHWTRSRENYAIMTKTFGYLLFMILILPSLGLFSASAFIEWTVAVANKTQNGSATIKFECIFLPDRGAFFVNYVITMCFIGTALELIRFPDLIMYIYRILTARSTAETPHIRKSIVIEFIFGIHYSWTIMVFTMGTVYSLACPLITPFALIYLMLKNFNDKHNLYFAYGPSHMVSQGGIKIHSTAVTMTKFSVVLLLIAFTGISYLRGGNEFTPRTTVLMFSLVSSLTIFGCMSPIKRCTTKPLTIIEDESAPMPGEICFDGIFGTISSLLSLSTVYIADVFLNNRINGNSPSHISYGSSDITSNDFDDSPEAVNNHVRV